MKRALETIRDYPINANSDPEAMAQAIEAIQAIAADAIDADTAAKLAPPTRDTRLEHMEAFIRSMANMTTPEDEFADPDLSNKEMYGDIEEMLADISNDRLYDEYAVFMAMVRDARKILAGEATADSGHVAPQPMKGQTNETL